MDEAQGRYVKLTLEQELTFCKGEVISYFDEKGYPTVSRMVGFDYDGEDYDETLCDRSAITVVMAGVSEACGRDFTGSVLDIGDHDADLECLKSGQPLDSTRIRQPTVVNSAFQVRFKEGKVFA
eukprot:COSAG01_NODE_21365_length_905_cov_1.173697_1_plen_124_part_00